MLLITVPEESPRQHATLLGQCNSQTDINSDYYLFSRSCGTIRRQLWKLFRASSRGHKEFRWLIYVNCPRPKTYKRV